MNSIAHPQTSKLPDTPTTEAGQWPASLSLDFSRRQRGTRLVRCRHKGPLYVQRAFYPEGPELAHVYLLHPPGGLVSGDHLKIRLHLEAGTAVLCTTPGAGRLYRARSDRRLQQQHNLLLIDDGSSLEWFPQETLVYNGAVARLETRVEMAASACFMGWEIVSLGLPACGVPFTDGAFTQRLVIVLDGIPALIERLHLAGSASMLLNSAAGLQAQTISGTFVCGPFAEGSLAESTVQVLRSTLQQVVPAVAALTRLGAFLVVRYLGASSAEARRVFLQCWQLLRPLLLNRPACAPRIWAT